MDKNSIFVKKIQSESGLKSKILIGVMIFSILFLVNFASAELFTFDNVKNYDAEKQEVTIVNTFGLGEDLAKVKLNTPLHNVINQLGYVPIAEFEVNNLKEYENILNDMKSYNKKDGDKEIQVVYDYKIKVNKTFTYINYLGKEVSYNQEVWEDIDLKNIKLLKDQKITVSLWTTVKDGDFIEWIPEMYGKTITEFASYEGVGGTKTYYLDGSTNYTVHTFTSTGTFNWTGADTNVSILIVAGGGGGGKSGGGAGGVYYNNSYTMSAGWHNITVGLGGTGSAGATQGVFGQNSTFDGIIAWGGGAGSPSDTAGRNAGGSASGGGLTGSPPKIWGNTTTNPKQGNRGGATLHGSTGYPASGSGGCGGVGGNTSNATAGGDGGIGCQYDINGTLTYYAGGGGGALAVSGGSNYYGRGGAGGGGDGKIGTGSATSGINGTGGGGGGGDGSGGHGGSGIVIIRYVTETETPITNPTVVLNSPENYYNTTNPSITFNATAIDYNVAGAIANVSLYIDNALDQTNSTIGNNSNYIFTKVLSSGIHNWSILAYNINGTSNQSTTRFINLTIASPVITLNSPIAYYNTTNPSVTLNVSVSDNLRVQNVTLYIDGVLNETNATAGNNLTYIFNKTFSEGEHYWSILAYDNDSNPSQSANRYLTINTTPSVVLTAPVNYDNLTYNNIKFNATVNSVYDIANVTFYLNGSANETVTTGVNGSYVFSKFLVDGYYYWSIKSCSSLGGCNQSAIRYLTIDTLSPSLSVTGITDLYGSTYPISLTWNLFNADIHVSNCWYYTSDDTTNRSIVCNSSTITNFTTDGSKTIYYFGNDTFGNQATGSSGLLIRVFSSTDNSDKSILGDGDNVLLTLYVNGTDINTLYPTTNATLWYNNTNYTPDTTDRTNQNYTKFTKTIAVYGGNSTGVKNYFNWSFNIKNSTTTVSTQTTSLKNVTVYSIAITDCAVLSGRYLLNLSLKDEELNSLVNGSLNSTNIEIDLMLTSRANPDQTWNFSKQWTDENFVSICVTPSALTSSSYKIDFTVGYKADGYVQEFYYMDNGTLDNTYYFNSYTFSNISLMDLESADSTTFLFSFKDENNLEVEDAIVHVYRKYIGSGVFREVERSKQDNNGETHIHLVEEDVIYYFMITQYGHIIYTSSTYNAKCLSSPCQIQLTASPDFIEFPDDYDEINGTLYTVTTNKTTRTVTLSYSSDVEKLINFSLYKMVDGEIVFVNTSSETGTSGIISIVAPYSYENITYFASIFADNIFVRSDWVYLTEMAQEYFGTTGAILGGLVVLALILMAVSEGIVLIIITVIALIIIFALNLVDFSWLSIVLVIVAGGLIIWKVRDGGNRR